MIFANASPTITSNATDIRNTLASFTSESGSNPSCVNSFSYRRISGSASFVAVR